MRADLPPDEVEYTCPDCGQVGTLDVLYDYDALRRAVTREDIARSPDPIDVALPSAAAAGG